MVQLGATQRIRRYYGVSEIGSRNSRLGSAHLLDQRLGPDRCSCFDLAEWKMEVADICDRFGGLYVSAGFSTL